MVKPTMEFICHNCFEDRGLVEFIKSNAIATECDSCLTEDNVPIAAHIDEVSEHFIDCLFREYTLAADELGWVGSEGGYIGPHWDTWDLVCEKLEMEFPEGNMESLLPHLFGEYYGEVWCERNPYGLNDSERTKYSWERFCYIVMHERRYFFLDQKRDSDDPEVYSPKEVLSTTFDYATEMSLFTELPAGSQLMRARWEGDGPLLTTPKELGPPPVEKATQFNRMSPAGIPMFYACEDEKTALRETASGPGKFAVGRFETLKPVIILNLTGIPPIPSLFERVPDSAEISPRTALTFLRHITEEISRPIKRDGKFHIEYVPTQVVAEFIRDQLTSDGTPISGIKYASSVHRGHASYVLFANQDDVEAASDRLFAPDPWLKLGDVNHRVVGG